MITVDEDIVEYALRYTLGRHTYSVAAVAETICNNVFEFSEKALCNMARDIGIFLANTPKSDQMNDMDRDTWFKCFCTIVIHMSHESKHWISAFSVSGVDLNKICTTEDDWKQLDSEDIVTMKDRYLSHNN